MYMTVSTPHWLPIKRCLRFHRLCVKADGSSHVTDVSNRRLTLTAQRKSQYNFGRILIGKYAWTSKRFPCNLVVKLNMQIAEVQCYFIAKTAAKEDENHLALVMYEPPIEVSWNKNL